MSTHIHTPDDIGAKEPNKTLSVVGSVLVHALIIAGIAFAYSKQKPLPEVISMEASLVSGDDFSGMQAQIAAAYAANQAAARSEHTSNVGTIHEKITRNEKLSEYYNDLAEREQAYQEQMEKFANDLDQEILSEIELQRQMFEDEVKSQMKEVSDLERRERSNDEIARQNTKELNKARAARDERIAQIEAANRTVNVSLSDGQGSSSANSDSNSAPTTPTVGRGGVSGGNSSGAGGNSNKSEIISALQRHIRSYWSRTGKNQTMRVSLSVDASGNVSNLSVSGGDDYLRSQLENTIRAASPLTPVVGTNYRNLTFNFNIN